MIFAAGLGTRLKPITDSLPKALVPLAGKTLLQWQVERLRDAGIRDIVVNVHHFPDMIVDTIHRAYGWGCNIQVSDERDCLLETGGGLRKAKELLQSSSPNAPILVCNVDILSNIDIPSLCAAYNPKTMGALVVSPRQTQRYLLFDNEKILRAWTNKATGEVRPANVSIDDLQPYAFSGMQILNPAIFDLMDKLALEKGNKYSLIDLYLSMCAQYTFKAYIPIDYQMMDVGKIDQIHEAESFAQSLA